MMTLGRGAITAVLFAMLTVAGALPARAGDKKAPTGPHIDKAVETTKKAIQACMMPDDDKAFDAYLAVIHPERKPTAQAVSDIRRYSYKRFRKQCRHFIKGDDPATLVVLRMAPEELPAEADTFKLFFEPVSQPQRMPAPIIFRKLGDDWLIDTNSM